MAMGCAKTITETKVEYVKPEIPESLLSECDPLPSDSIKTNGDLLLAYISLQSSYALCSSKISSIKMVLESYDNIYSGE